MKFSIIIPVYNAEKFLKESIESILCQSYSNFEIVIVDDGSTDASGEICDRYARNYPEKLKVLHNKNQGPMAARNSGIYAASGDICLFLDADDCFRSDALEMLKECICKHSCDVVIFNASSNKDYEAVDWKLPYKDQQCFECESKRTLYEKLITSKELNAVWSKAVKRNIALAIPEEYRSFSGCYAEDLLQSSQIIKNAGKICYLDQNLYFYRKWKRETIRSYDLRKHRSIKLVHIELEKFIDRWGLEELHGKHFAREVHEWIECLRQLFFDTEHCTSSILREFAEDSYFRNAYENMEPGQLSKVEGMLSYILYKRWYNCLKAAGAAQRFLSAIKRTIKR